MFDRRWWRAGFPMSENVTIGAAGLADAIVDAHPERRSMRLMSLECELSVPTVETDYPVTGECDILRRIQPRSLA
jgi:hypothetical protein